MSKEAEKYYDKYRAKNGAPFSMGRIYKIMQSYADSQLKEIDISPEIQVAYSKGMEHGIAQLKAKMPTDEEIKEHFRTQHSHYKDGRYYKTNLHRIAGAKWLKQQITKP